MSSKIKTTAVSAETSGRNLIIPDVTSQSRFELGVLMALCNWTALSTAISSGWGGPNGDDKRDWMAGSIVQLFEEYCQLDAEDVEARLLQISQDEFDMSVEDDSAYDCAKLIMSLFNDCVDKKYSQIDQLYQRYLERQAKPREPVKIEDDDDNDEDDDDEDEDEDQNNDNDSMDTSTPSEPVIDEEGFELVQNTKGRGRRRH